MIRRFRAEDAQAVAELHADTIRRVNAAHYSPEQIAPWAGRTSAERFVASMDRFVRFVEDVDGAILGFSDYTPANAQLTGLYVSADHQGEGVGRSLYEAIEADARSRGLERLWLEATLTAVPFYEAMGFRKLRDSTYRVADQDLPIAVMEKPL